MPRIAPHEEGLHLRVYRTQDLAPEYYFYVANGPHDSRLPSLQLAETRSVPSKFRKELSEFLGANKIRKLGDLTYERYMKKAISTDYNPKGQLPAGMHARGLGTYLEALAAHHETKNGIEIFSSTASPSTSRLKQLNEAGHIHLNEEEKQLLKTGQRQSVCKSLVKRGELPAKYPAKEWLRGLGKKINASMKQGD